MWNPPSGSKQAEAAYQLSEARRRTGLGRVGGLLLSAASTRVQAAYEPRADGKCLCTVGRELLPMEMIEMDAMLTPAAKALPALPAWGLGTGVSTLEAIGGCASG